MPGRGFWVSCFVSGFVFRVSCYVFWVSGVGSRDLGLRLRVSAFGTPDSCFVFGDSGFVFRVEGFGVRVSCFVFRVSGFGLRDSGFGFRVSGLLFRVLGFELWVWNSCFVFRDSCFVF